MSLSIPQARLVPLIIATGLFMENLDATVLSTALPTIARDFGTSPIYLKLALTSYLLSLAIFIPASGWVADRFGARTVFRAAILVFGAGSIACGLSHGLTELVLARVLQGMSGAMMTPVGRLIILKTTPKHDLVGALSWLSVPALLGPVMGPPVGGFITAYLSWRWIFWVNIPIMVLGLVLTSLFIPNVRGEERTRFDILGFLLIGPGLAILITGATMVGMALVPTPVTIGLISVGAALVGLYIPHALRSPSPILELRLLTFPSFRYATIGGFLFRIGVGATPFLLPLLLQLGFAFDPFQSGLMTLSTGLGAMGMKTIVSGILRRVGFRRVMIGNAVLSSIFVAAPALFWAGMPVAIIMGLLLVGGFLRSLQFTSVNVAAVVDVPDSLMGRITSFTAVLQELSKSVGVSVAALGLESMQALTGTHALTAPMFAPVFVVIGLISLLSVPLFMRLPLDFGRDLFAGPVPAGAPAAAAPTNPALAPAAVAAATRKPREAAKLATAETMAQDGVTADRLPITP